MNLASYRWAAEKRARVNRLSAREKLRKYNSKSSLTSLKTFDSCNEQPYVPTQLPIATKKENQNKLICGLDKKANTQLAIATTSRIKKSSAYAKAACRYVIAGSVQRKTSERARKMKELTGKNESRVRQLSGCEKRRKLIQLGTHGVRTYCC